MKSKEFQKKENVHITSLGWRHYKYTCSFCGAERYNQASIKVHLTHNHQIERSWVAELLQRHFDRNLGLR